MQTKNLQQNCKIQMTPGDMVKVDKRSGRVTSMRFPGGTFANGIDDGHLTAFYFGRKEGAIVGGVGAFLLDLISGYPQWMFFSLLFHGGQGYFAGFKGKARYLGLLLATVVMVGGYALASALFLGNGWGAAISDIPNNLAQNFVGMALGYVVYYAFQKKGS